MSDDSRSLGTRTLRGMAWAYGAYFGGRMLVLVSTAILARVLSPRDFGMVAIALVVLTFMDAIQDLGLGEALIISRPGEEEDRAQTVFSWTLVFSVSLSLLTLAASPLIAAFFHQPSLTWIVAAMGSVFSLRALGSTHYAIVRKELNYRVRTVSEISEVTIRGLVSVGLALAGAGAWSLVLGYIAGVCASTTVLWLMTSFRPRASLGRRHLSDLLKFGGVLTLVDIGATLIYNLDYIFVGRILGTTALGLYTIGFRLPELVILNLANVAADVLFPAFSSVTPERLIEAYLVGLRYLAMAIVPVASALVVLARPVTLVAFGPHWIPSVDVMRVITIYTVCVAFSIPSGTIFKVTGRARIMVMFTVPAVLGLAVLLALFAHHGIVTVAWVTTGVQGAGLPLAAFITSRQLGVSVLSSIRVLVPTFVAAGCMIAVLLAVDHLVTAPVPALAIGGVSGAVVYLGVLMIISRETLERLREMAFPRAAARS